MFSEASCKAFLISSLETPESGALHQEGQDLHPGVPVGASSSSSSHSDVNQPLLEAGPFARAGQGGRARGQGVEDGESWGVVGAQVPLDPTAEAGCLLSALGPFLQLEAGEAHRKDRRLRMTGGVSALLCSDRRLAGDVHPNPDAHCAAPEGLR